jgi:hypothetical protein
LYTFTLKQVPEILTAIYAENLPVSQAFADSAAGNNLLYNYSFYKRDGDVLYFFNSEGVRIVCFYDRGYSETKEILNN